MLQATQGKEIYLRLPNEIGALARVSKIVAERGVNVLAANAWVEGDEGVIRLLTDDQLRASDTLKEHGFRPEERDVVVVEGDHKPGVLRHLTDRLAQENLDIHHLYASAMVSQDKCLIVVQASDNARAAVLLND